MIGSLFTCYYKPRMATDIRNYCKQYQACQVYKVVIRVPQGQLQPLPVPEYCQQYVTMDLITYLPRTDCGVDAIATFIDRLSKYIYFVPVTTSYSIDDVAQVFLSIVIAWNGVPERPILDHDPHFVSDFWKGLMLALGA